MSDTGIPSVMQTVSALLAATAALAALGAADRSAPLARRHPGHPPRAVLAAGQGMESALLAGDALHHQARVAVHPDRHLSVPLPWPPPPPSRRRPPCARRR